MLAGIIGGQDLYSAVVADTAADIAVGIEGPGGSGKTAVLEAIRTVYRAAGVPVLAAEALTDDPDAAVGAAVIVDDAHELDPALLKQLHGLIGTALVSEESRAIGHGSADTSGVRLFVAFRPWPRPPELSDLAAALRRTRLIALEPLDRAGVEIRATAVLGRSAAAVRIDELLTRTGGLPALVDLLLASAGDDGAPSDANDRLRQLVDSLDDAPRGLLTALTIGCPLDRDVVSALLQLDADYLPDLIEQAGATGFVRSDGTVIPLIREAVLAMTPSDRMRELRAELYEIKSARGEGVVELARAAALTGQLDEALRIADRVLADPTSPDIPSAVHVAATALAHRGLLGRAAELYRWLGPSRVGSGAALAALTFLGTGDRAAGEEMVQASVADQGPTMAAGAQTLMAQGLWESITGSATRALSTLSRATTLLEPAGPTVLLPDTPAALTALLAIHVGELDIAESALYRAAGQDLGGPLARARHQLLLAWIAMLRGQFDATRDLVTRAQSVNAGPEPRDELFVQALEVGVARRTSNAPALVQTWSAAREAIVRHPVDLFVLLPLGELTVAAARLRDSARVAPHLDEAWRLLRGLGDPALWATPLHWYGVHAALLSGRAADLEPHAAALLRAARTSAYAASLAEAGRAWMDVLHGEIDADAVEAAARGLQSVGLAWDGSRLLGQAAARSTDRKAMAALLQVARAMQEPQDRLLRDPSGGGSPTPTPAVVLSAREREVGVLLLQNRTYREIGETLFISAKTVEHHVARIKRSLGVTTRSELFAKLRQILGSSDGNALSSR